MCLQSLFEQLTCLQVKGFTIFGDGNNEPVQHTSMVVVKMQFYILPKKVIFYQLLKP